jgi:hypothetical protein
MNGDTPPPQGVAEWLSLLLSIAILVVFLATLAYGGSLIFPDTGTNAPEYGGLAEPEGAVQSGAVARNASNATTTAIEVEMQFANYGDSNTTMQSHLPLLRDANTSGWNRTGRTFSMNTTVPANGYQRTNATVVIPGPGRYLVPTGTHFIARDYLKDVTFAVNVSDTGNVTIRRQ